MSSTKLVIGIDVGSTTCKMAVVDPESKKIIWSKYQRHETKQPEYVRDMLIEILEAFPDVAHEDIRTFITGSGGGPIGPHIGAKFVQEVNSVTMAVEELHPDVGSVVELGGQDAKIIIFKENKETGDKQSTCLDERQVCVGHRRHHRQMHDQGGYARRPEFRCYSSITANCTTWPPSAVSLPRPISSTWSRAGFRALEDSELAGRRDRPAEPVGAHSRQYAQGAKVLLLGGPNTYLPFLQQCWRLRIPEPGTSAATSTPKMSRSKSLIFVPENAEYCTPPTAPCSTACTNPPRSGVYRGPGPAARVHRPRAQGQAR